MLFEDNRGNIFLIVSAVIVIAITGIFMYSVRPRAVVIAKGGEEEIILQHLKGVDLVWDELDISIAKEGDNGPNFRDPTEASLVDENRTFEEAVSPFIEGGEVSVVRDSQGQSLQTENEYIVILKHNPSGITITEMSVSVKEDFN